METLADIVSDSATALLDSDSLRINWDWDKSRFPLNAHAACLTIQAMNILQSTKDGATTLPIIDECMNFHISYLPEETKAIFNYQPAWSVNNPSHLFDINLTAPEFKRLNRDFHSDRPAFFENVRNARWTIIPIGANGHWTTIILYTKKIEMSGTSRGYRTIIKNAVVADPEKTAKLEALIWNRLREVLSERRGFTFKHSQPVKLWFPKQSDTNTCGFRVYEIMRVMLMRISQSAAEEGLKDGYNPAIIWRDLSGDFQPDKVRAEMIGILANQAMRFTHWSTRICLVPVSHVKDRTIGALDDSWIPTDSCGARLSELPERKPLQYSEGIMVDRLLGLRVAPTPDLMQLSPDFEAATNPGFSFVHPLEWNPLEPRGPSSSASPPVPPRQPTQPQQPVGLGVTPLAYTPSPGDESSLPPALRRGSKSAPATPGGLGLLVTPSKVPLPPSGPDTPLETTEGSSPKSNDDSPMGNT